MASWIQTIDGRVVEWFQAHHTGSLDYHLQSITALGSTTLLAVFSLFGLGLLLLDRRYRALLLAALVFSGVHFGTAI